MTLPSVAILHYTCPPTVGGVEMLMGVHARLFSEAGYPTRVITGRGEPFRADVPVVVIPSLYSKDPELLDVNDRLDRGVVDEPFHRLTEKIYRSLVDAMAGADCCIVHNAFTLHFNLPLTAALHRLNAGGKGPRFVSWCHDVSWKNELYIPRMRDEFPWNLLKTALKGITYVTVSSARQAELSDCLGLPAEEFRVVPAGVDPTVQLKLEAETAGLVSRLALLDAELLMLAPVRITRRKNLEQSIRVAGALRDRSIRVRLVVTGPPGPHNVRSGDYVDELMGLRKELRLEDEVVFLFEEIGPVSDRMMFDLYSLSDLLLFSSAQEGFGIPLLEAGLFRLPVFCSNIPPFREIGLDIINYFEPGENPAVVAERIHRWMEADAAHRLRRRVLSGYSWNSLFKSRIEPLVAERR